MALILLFIIAVMTAKYEQKGVLDKWVVLTARWLPVLTAPLWYGGGLFVMCGLLAFFQAVYVPTRNYFEGKDTWFIDESSCLGRLVSKYLGQFGGRTLYIAEAVLGILLIII